MAASGRRPLFKDPENLLIGFLLAVFMERVGGRVSLGQQFWDACASSAGELLAMGLMGVVIGWFVKSCRALLPLTPQALKADVCAACQYPKREGAVFCPMCGTAGAP